MRKSIVLALITLLLAGCSSEQLYATGRNAQRAECMKQADSAARDRCLKDAGMSHDAYQKEADAARK
jgi:Prokaryotic membrane lipoprotein lipid attachment site